MEHEHSELEEIEQKEAQDWKAKLIGAWIFTIPIALLMISGKIGLMIPEGIMLSLILVFAFPVIFFFGFRTLKMGFLGFRNFYFNMDSLIALGTVVAYITGILSIVLPVQDYSGISAMIMSIFITGKYIEAKARGKASQEIKKLLELGAKYATVIRNKKEMEIPASEIKVGDIMIVKPGQKIPTDGVVIRGESSIDESMISGESMPIEKNAGSKVIGATINQDGILYIKATKIGSDTFLAHIIKVVEETQSSKIPIQKLADKITNIFVPVILIISVLTFIGWAYFYEDLGKAFGSAIAVLVIACPCSLGLAVPIALMVGSGIGAKNGVLIRKGEAIQTLEKVKIIVFDKTGTITNGKPEVTDVFSKVKENYLLEIAASLEKSSEHPIAKAVVEYVKLKRYRKVENFKTHRGRGLEGKMGRKNIIMGNRILFEEKRISLKGFEDKIDEYEKSGKTTMIVAEDRKVLGIIAVADDVKEDSVKALVELQRSGFRTVMITGDNAKTAEAIAKKVGIQRVIANVLPEEKANEIKRLQEEGMVAFVGDGINDAPALKQSNVGIAIGSGSDIAIEAGDLVLTSGSLMGVVHAINLSNETFKKIRQNLFWAFGYNVVAIPLAVAGILHPVIAELAMALSSISVVTNANLLRRKKI